MQWQFPIAMAVYVQLPEGITEYPQFCCFIPSQPVKCPFTRRPMTTAKITVVTCVAH